jgi:RHS repeat-associated protein
VEGEPEAEENGVYYLLRDHLGSASVTVKEHSGALTKYAELRYKPWGEDRPTSEAFNETLYPSERRFTGQRAHDELGLYHYQARWYDPALGRFVQPDSIVPESQGVQAWDRYGFVNNNPLNYVDPSGYRAEKAWFTRKTPPPPRKPTSTPQPTQPSLQDIFNNHRTPTPQGPVYLPGSTSTPTHSIPTSTPNRPIKIDIQVDWSNVDWIDAGIDTFGLLTNGTNIVATISGAPEAGLLVDVIGDVVEVGGLIKAGYDISQGDPQNLRLQLASDSVKQLALIAKAERTVPYIGFIGNITSLWLNFQPTISIH